MERGLGPQGRGGLLIDEKMGKTPFGMKGHGEENFRMA